MKLNNSEKFKLVFEGLITFILIILVYIAAFEIFMHLMMTSDLYAENYWLIGDIVISVREQRFVGLTPVVIVLLGIIAAIFIYWRLRRRQRQYEIRHIINELQHIAEGHYEHRITGHFSQELGDFVDSIHVLVDSTIEAMEEERRIEKTKDELITNVSHDIRTPLTSIIGYLGLIKHGHYETEEELQEYAGRAFAKSQQMKSLVEDLFEFTRVRQTDTPLTLIDFDMIQLLDQLAVDFELEAENQDMKISLVTDLDELIMQGDSEKIVRLINNLISNAIKYGYQGHDIILEVEKTERNALIRVKNIGEPLSQDVIDQVFERFYRVEKSRSQKVSGAGLGLAISKSLVELHGGTIQAYTDKPWTVFAVSLPLEQF